MDALMQMIAVGWPLGLAGFILGALVGGFMARGGETGNDAGSLIKPDADGLEALAAELKAAKELLEAEEAEAAEVAETLKNLDEAIKRANGRLKLITKAVKQAK
ncbi:hypothetical protein [Hyphococcus sp.]|uniref:hypothetical protein n=1 Tax=Hyphococcus sp. TaxID=2038636 RepID=UPI0035C72CE4